MLHANLEQVLKQMLKDQLSYADRQLIQQEKLKEVAERNLRFQRRILWVLYGLILTFATLPECFWLLSRLFSGNPPDFEPSRFHGPELALLHLPLAIYLHFNISRFEMIYFLWTCSAEDEPVATENQPREATTEHCLANC